MYPESDLLPLSALQHLAFCERQCALIHIEGVWNENQLTAALRLGAAGSTHPLRATTFRTAGMANVRLSAYISSGGLL
jgi:hypothetical protein